MHIETHRLQSGMYEEQWEEDTDDLIDLLDCLPLSPHNVHDAIHTACSLLGLASFSERPTVQWSPRLRAVLACGGLLFDAFELPAGAQHEASLDSVTLTLPTGGKPVPTTQDWIHTFAAALFLEDQARIASLDQFVMDRFQNFYEEDWRTVLVWVLTHRDAPEHWPHLINLERGVRWTPQDTLAPHIARPLLTLTRAYLERDPEAFDITLQSALFGFKTANEIGERPMNPRHLLFFEGLILCALAQDSGMPISTTSPYIPRWLYTRQFDPAAGRLEIAD